MKTLEQIKKDLLGLTVFEDAGETLEEMIIEIFEDHAEDGVTEVIVTDTHTATNVEDYGLCEEFSCYINSENSECINFAIHRQEYTIEIVAVF